MYWVKSILCIIVKKLFFTIIIHISVPKQYADTLDFKEMLIRILCNKPPSYEELLKPKDYYRRISS